MSREYCDYILDQLAPMPGISARRMFGGFGLFHGGLMFGIIIEDVLYYKTAANNRVAYETAGAEPFRYKSKNKTVTLSYWTVPALDDEDTLLEWTRKPVPQQSPPSQNIRKSLLKQNSSSLPSICVYQTLFIM